MNNFNIKIPTIADVIVSHYKMKKDISDLTAAYKTNNDEFKKYKQNVIERERHYSREVYCK